ncbi:MAG: glutamate synthase-related protein [Desulfobacterales bacterium]|nr:glutamate synthase-related protein [Desulfobacterales bacterium]
MPKKFHIPIKTAPPRFEPIGKYATVEFREDCAGSCKACVKKNCVYGVFQSGYQHMRSMDEPAYLYTCQSCFRCVQECTKGIFSRVINPAYRALGDGYWLAGIILQTWYQAHTGKIPVSGAGYRGPFTGKGFDAMWTDMSEIVRPTRDGIHGREYINTCIELTRRVSRLDFTNNSPGNATAAPILEIPLPVLFQAPDLGIWNVNVQQAAAAAAQRLGTLLLLKPEDFTDALAPHADALVPCLTQDNYHRFSDLVHRSRMVELAYTPQIIDTLPKLRALRSDLVISIGVPLDDRAASRAVELTRAAVDTIHFYADAHGNSPDTDPPRFLTEMIREVHLELVDQSIRQAVNLIFSGGIAMAEHMAKAIICGADGVVLDRPLLIALECRLCGNCRNNEPCPVKIDEIDPQWGLQRMVNLMGAWHNQLLEVMGAMGIREARRLRGEVGRAMWFEDLEKENFAPIFGRRQVS